MDLNVPKLNSTPATGSFDINSLPLQLWRRRRLFVMVVSLTFFLFFAVILLLQPMFSASGSVVIGNLEPSENSVAAWIQKLGDPADLESQLLIAKSSRMLRLALERPGVLDAVHEECRKKKNLTLTAADCSKLKAGSLELLRYVGPRYTVRAEGRSRVISIAYRSPVPEVAFILANALLITYLEDQRAENARTRIDAATWVLKADGRSNESTAPASPVHSLQNFYQDLQKKATDFETEMRDLPSPARLVSLAEIPTAPDPPQRSALLAAGLTIATIVAGFVAVRKDLTDRTVRRPQDLELLTAVPVFALPPPPRAAAEGWAAVARSLLRRPFSIQKRISLRAAAAGGWQSLALAKAARALYARLILELSGYARRCIVVASAAAGEGRTFTAMALARAAAESGCRVLVIDCDLQASGVNSNIQPEVNKGLSGILRGEIAPGEATVATAIGGLECIEAGGVDGEQAAFLIGGQLSKIMSWAEQYDLVLLVGPAGVLPEVQILAGHADGLLWCVRWGHTLLPEVEASLTKLHSWRSRLLALAVTMTDPKEVSYYHR